MAGGLYMMSKELAQAELLFKQFKHKEAYPIFQQLADAGDARAMYFMGIYSRLYLGVGHYNPKKSMEWFQKGMEKGDVLCAISLGYLQEEKKRDDFMKEWLPKAEELAAAGDVFAMDDIADCYFYGLGTSVDEKRGLESIDKAADAGYWLAAYDQATQYDDNGHRDTDYAKACAAYKEVSKLGYSEADYRLGFHYFQGIGVERDVKEAVRLWEKAWNLGNAAAANALGFVYSFDEKLKDDKFVNEHLDSFFDSTIQNIIRAKSNENKSKKQLKNDLKEKKRLETDPEHYINDSSEVSSKKIYAELKQLEGILKEYEIILKPLLKKIEMIETINIVWIFCKYY